MEIKKYKKIGINKYKVSFEDNDIVLYEDIILKYELIKKNKINLETLEKILEDNKEYEIYDLSLKYLDIKMRCKKEIYKYLERKNFSTELIEKTIDKLVNNGYINDKIYVKSYINDQINLKNSGPYKIKKELLDLEIDENIVDEALENVEECVWNVKTEKIINKIISLNKNKSIKTLKNKIVETLYLKGYDSEKAKEYIENIDIDENENILKEYNKAYKKYSLKYEGIVLKNKIIIYLQRKGYPYNNIIKIIE